MGNGNPKGSAGGAFGIVRNHIENLNAELLAQRAEDGSDEQGRKKAEGHGSQRINQVGLHGNVYIFSFQKLLDTC